VKLLAGRLALALAASLLTIVLLEGAASVLLAGRDFAGWRPQQNAEFHHARYDPGLGWVNEPHATIPDLYGPGRSLHTNARGFRGTAETADAPAPGTVRVVCSGDSFTLGFGVRDEETWCAQLAALVPGLEAVNMGQGGYGFDQAWLWYRRDGAALEHQIHVLAWITDDFQRMWWRRFDGYGKPRLALRDGALVVTDTPAATRGALFALGQRTHAAVRDLRLAQLSARLARRIVRGSVTDSLARDSVTRDVVAAVVRDLAAFHRGRGSRLVLVHLPVRQDSASAMSDTWREWMRRTAEREGVTYVDLVAAMRAMAPDSVRLLFLPRDGHYSVAGNRWVAAMLREPIARAAPAR
jgi:hypothetical protein